MKLLHIDSSPLAGQSASRALTARIVAEYLAAHPGTQVEHLDLAADPVGHLDADTLSFRSPAGVQLTERQQRENARTRDLLRQLLEADVVVIGAPMYNFSIPSQLKAWIDRVAQPGHTFRYTDKGPEGLAMGKQVIVASTRGGLYAGQPAEGMDHQERYLTSVLGFMGMHDVRFVRAEGLAMGEEARSKALASAEAQLKAYVARAANEPAAALAA